MTGVIAMLTYASRRPYDRPRKPDGEHTTLPAVATAIPAMSWRPARRPMRVEFRITEDDSAKAMRFYESRHALRFPSAIISAIILILVTSQRGGYHRTLRTSSWCCRFSGQFCPQCCNGVVECLASEASAILVSAAGNFAQCLGNHCRGHLA
jgi:hypothetical protein